MGALCLAVAPAANAAVVLDQDAIVAPAGIGSVEVDVGVRQLGGRVLTLRTVQTITAGRAGLLNSIDFQGAPLGSLAPSSLRLTLIDGDYAAGARAVVGTKLFSASNTPDYAAALTSDRLIPFQTDSFKYAVTPGKVFSVLFEAVPVNQFGRFSFTTGNYFGQVQLPNGTFQSVVSGANYARGTLYQLSSAGNLLEDRLDIGFRSFVASVPEPGTWAMLILGFGTIGGALRRARGLKPVAATA